MYKCNPEIQSFFSHGIVNVTSGSKNSKDVPGESKVALKSQELFQIIVGF